MLLNQINLNHLRIFEAVFRTGSMTQAAQEMYLTQSGISQHIKSLEDALSLQLFDRIKQKLLPTEDGKKLYAKILPQLKNLEDALREVTKKDDVLRGEVSIGMPVVFGLNVILPYLSDLAKSNSELKYHLKFDMAEVMNELLLEGSVDFAFVDEFDMDPRIKTINVYDEVLHLCGSSEYMKKVDKKLTGKAFFESLDYICYAKGEPILRRWLQHHIKGGAFDLKVKAIAADTLAIEKFITNHIGLGVLPGHQVNLLKSQGYDIVIVEEKQKELKNKISVAFLENRTLSIAVDHTLKYLIEELKKREAAKGVQK